MALALHVYTGERCFVRLGSIQVEIYVKQARTGRVTLGFDAPDSVRIWRSEIAPPLPTPKDEFDRIRTRMMNTASVAEIEATREELRRSCVPQEMIDGSDWKSLVEIARRRLAPRRVLT